MRSIARLLVYATAITKGRDEQRVTRCAKQVRDHTAAARIKQMLDEFTSESRKTTMLEFPGFLPLWSFGTVYHDAESRWHNGPLGWGGMGSPKNSVAVRARLARTLASALATTRSDRSQTPQARCWPLCGTSKTWRQRGKEKTWTDLWADSCCQGARLDHKRTAQRLTGKPLPARSSGRTRLGTCRLARCFRRCRRGDSAGLGAAIQLIDEAARD